MASKFLSFYDSLYGDVSLNETTTMLVSAPEVQRLRHVRLSNIDSVTMPGISGLSRYEHVIGVAYLAQNTGLTKRLSSRDMVALTAAALLHDWAITAFGHLVEEAFQYAGASFNHETKLYEIVMGEGASEIGGVDRQFFRGRSGLRRWLERVAPSSDVNNLLKDIIECISGKGKLGRVVSGDIDLDNIDNVFRMAFHMGLGPDRGIPRRLAAGIVGIDEVSGRPLFSRSVESDISTWLITRRQVYERLMLSETDFVGKLMLLYATVKAWQQGELLDTDWNLVDDQFLSRLLKSRAKECSDTVDRWLVGDVWATTPLFWMTGRRPDYPEVLRFSESLSIQLGRTCFAYCIKDKRDRKLDVMFEDGSCESLGHESSQWLLGVGSPVKKTLGASQIREIVEYAESYFQSKQISEATIASSTDAASITNQLGLL